MGVGIKLTPMGPDTTLALGGAMKYVLYEIDPFSGLEVLPSVEISCSDQEILRIIADQQADFYRVRDPLGKLVLECLPSRLVQGQRVPVIDLYYGAIEPGQAKHLFGHPPGASFGAGSAPMAVAKAVIWDTLGLVPDSPGVWFSEAPRIPRQLPSDPVSMSQVGHVDHKFPHAIVRVNFLTNN